MVVDLPTTQGQEDGSQSVVLPSASSGLPGGDMHFRPESNAEATPMLALPAPSPSTSAPEPEGPIMPLDENGHRYVGLVNQAMTCYLNSLVQTLYMTPEFRNSIYRWEYKSANGKGGGESSIPCQIQKLFLMLQTSCRDAMETTDLTASFGWTSNEAYDQHDVQELCRLMFDALEHRWKGSPHEKLIQNLYRGSMQDFVKCLHCKKENAREDFFLDLPLALKPFGAHEAYKSVEDALKAFVTPEKLEGSNQYNCENCNAKRDAHKGLRITQFPYLLTIQLKRFDFDYNTMHRIKLNDKMTFPDILNLNPFVYDPKNPEKKEVDDPNELLYNGAIQGVGTPLNKQEITRLLKQGEYVYELFSVMVHQGSAAGGHYFAYIKNLDQDSWYCFNDTRVDHATTREIEKSYGGMYGGWSNSNTNAYMLMYRKIRDKKNESFIRTEKLPEHIVQLQNLWQRLEEDKERQREYQASLLYITIELNIVCEQPDLINQVHKFEIPRTSTLAEVHNQAWKFFDERASSFGVKLAKKQSRLIRVDGEGKMRQAFVSKNEYDRKLEQLFTENDWRQGVNTMYFLFDFPRNVGSHQALKFPVKFGDQDPLTICIHRVDIQTRTVSPPYRINLPDDKNHVVVVKAEIGKALGVEASASIKARLVLQVGDQYSNKFKLLDSASTVFREVCRESYMRVPILYYDGGVFPVPEAVLEDRKKDPDSSEMFKILDRKKFASILKLRIPSDDDIQRAHVFTNSIVGPSWQDTVASSTEKTETQLEVASPEEITSGRSSPSSLNDEAMLGTDSLCNNTPAVSPAISDGDEGYEERNLSRSRSLGLWDLSGQEEVMRADYYINPPESMMGESIPASHTRSSSSTLVASSVADCGQNIIILEKVPEQNVIYVDVDSRISILELKQWLSRHLKIDPAQFQFLRHQQDDFSDRGWEFVGQDDDNISSGFNNSSNIDVQLRPPLKRDEKLLKVILVDMEEHNKDNWKLLCEVPASRSTLVGDFLLQCHRLYNEIFQTNISYKQVRLRDISATGKTIFNPEQTFESQRQIHNFTNNVFFHVMDESLIGKKGDPIFIRRFRPSSVESGPIQEIVVDSTSDEDHWKLLKEAIGQKSGIPAEHVDMVEPSIGPWDFGKWPYSKNRLELLDGSVKFHNLKPIGSTLPDEFIQKIGNRVVYYRDNREQTKELTDDERKQITIKDNSATNSAQQRRKERPLRIQMSSISES